MITRILFLPLLAAPTNFFRPALAQDDDTARDALEEILVVGRAMDLVGAADSASEGMVGYGDLTTWPRTIRLARTARPWLTWASATCWASSRWAWMS